MKPEQVTAEWLEGRCHEEGDCLVWGGNCGHGQQPRYRFRDEDLDSSLHLRPIAWRVYGGRELRKIECLTMACQNPRCLNKGHMRVTTKRQVLQRNSQIPTANLVRHAAITRTIRAQRAKLTMEQARMVRESDRTLTDLAQELGVSFQLLSKVRRGEAWPEIQANPFQGLFTGLRA